MNIQYRTGDILRCNIRLLAQQVNASGRFASGLAKQTSEEHPFVRDEYYRAFAEGRVRMGQTLWIESKPYLHILCVGQQNYGRKASEGIVYTSYPHLRSALKEINIVALELGEQFVAFPLIGCGLAGGSWKIVSSMIEEESSNFQPVVFLMDGKQPEV